MPLLIDLNFGRALDDGLLDPFTFANLLPFPIFVNDTHSFWHLWMLISPQPVNSVSCI
jgi:hypothetical protein